jgi:hypothetical protein
MSNQVICDECGEPIDTTDPYFTASLAEVVMGDGGMVTATGHTEQLDFHPDHLPGPLGTRPRPEQLPNG